MSATESKTGTLYIAHIEPPYKHAGHYLGWTSAPLRRWNKHMAGKGSPLIKAALEAGHSVTWHVIGPGTRADEARIKRMGSYGAMHCPVCRPGYLARTRTRIYALRNSASKR